jgi:oligopeptide transport system ATP-binding protein
VVWRGRRLDQLPAKDLRPVRKEIQLVFQDPLDALDPRMTVGELLAEPLWNLEPSLGKREIATKVTQVLHDVGLSPEQVNRYPHEFSGGQCQRIGIARAMILEPKLIVCDEPVSALDVSIQAQILNLLMDLRDSHSLSLIFISHDLSVVQRVSHRILVLYLGRVVELADAQSVCESPHHPYTRALLNAVPLPDPRQERERLKRARPLVGELPSPLNPPSGCVFRTRCPKASDICASQKPPLEDRGGGHLVACHH